MKKVIISIILMLIATFLNTITKLSINILNKGEGTVDFKTTRISILITHILKIILFLIGLIGTIYFSTKLKLLIVFK